MTWQSDQESTHKCPLPGAWDMRDAWPGSTWQCLDCGSSHLLAGSMRWERTDAPTAVPFSAAA